MRPFRPLILALIALLAIGLAPAVAKNTKPAKGKTPAAKGQKGAKGKAKGKAKQKSTAVSPVTMLRGIKVGIADQKAGVFTDPLFRSIGIKYARRSVGWDTLQYDWQVRDVDAWLTAARAAGVTPLITFAKSRIAERRRYLPTVAEYRAAFVAFHRRWPWVKEYAATNESNHPAEMGGRSPKRAVEYWRAMQSACPGCKVAAATLLDFKPTLIKWTKAFVKYAGRKQPKYWALHNYVSANKFDDSLTKQLLKIIKGEVWITEVGGVVYRKPAPGRVKLAEGVPHQTKVTRYVLTKMLRTSKRIKRVYLYHWNSEAGDTTWDSGLIDRNGKPRPSLAIVEKALGKGTLPKAKPGKPTPVGPANGALPSRR